jgi:hypothetical protein
MNKQILITAIVMLALGAGGGYWLAIRQIPPSPPFAKGGENEHTHTFIKEQSPPFEKGGAGGICSQMMKHLKSLKFCITVIQ